MNLKATWNDLRENSASISEFFFHCPLPSPKAHNASTSNTEGAAACVLIAALGPAANRKIVLRPSYSPPKGPCLSQVVFRKSARGTTDSPSHAKRTWHSQKRWATCSWISTVLRGSQWSTSWAFYF